MRRIAVLTVLMGGLALVVHSAVGGHVDRQIVRETKQASHALEMQAQNWAGQFSR